MRRSDGLLQHFTRELRELRGALIALGVIAVMVPVVLHALVLREIVSGFDTPDTLVLCALAASILVLGSEVMPGERMRGTLPFHGRSPAGASRVFLTKLTVVFLLPLVTALISWATYSLITRGDPWTPSLDTPSGLLLIGLMIFPGLLLWTLAAGAWVPSGVLAPAVALLFGFASLWIFSKAPLLFGRSIPEPSETLVYLACFAISGLVAAKVAFDRACSPSIGAGRVLAGNLGILAVGLIPALWVGVVRADRGFRLGFQPSDEDSGLHLGFLDPESGHLVLLAESDLQNRGQNNSAKDPWPLSLVHARDPNVEVIIEIDLNTGESWQRSSAMDSDWKASLFDGTEPFRQRFHRASLASLPPLSIEEGLRFGPESTRYGRGWTAYDPDRESMVIVDPFRKRIFTREELGLPLSSGYRILVREGRWVVSERRSGRRMPWCFFDPETHQSEPITGIGEDDWTDGVLPDDRLLVSGSPESEVSFILDPESGDRTELWSDSDLGDRPRFSLAESGNARIVPGDPVLVYGTCFGALDLETGRVEKLFPMRPVISWNGNLPDGRIVAIVDWKSVVAFDLEGNSETLFPR